MGDTHGLAFVHGPSELAALVRGRQLANARLCVQIGVQAAVHDNVGPIQGVGEGRSG